MFGQNPATVTAAAVAAPVRHRFAFTYITPKAVTLKINRPFPTEAVQPFDECFQANVFVSSFDLSHYFSWNSLLQCRFLLLFPRGKFGKRFHANGRPLSLRCPPIPSRAFTSIRPDRSPLRCSKGPTGILHLWT